MHRSSQIDRRAIASRARQGTSRSNPEKSLVGIAASGGQAFRYAPLSSGLEMGRYVIAIVQSPANNKEVALVRFSIVRCWRMRLSSEWPVCRIGDMASPHACALTYAGRYALFTPVGIAGEDHLDAPDLGQSRE